jgi:hypothetical protein
MAAIIIKWIIIVMGLVNGAYMTFDGAKALITGDYLRPKEGEYAGQLGPWTKIVEPLGIDPMGAFMKSVFLVYGIAWLAVTACFILGFPWSWKAMLVLNILTLWNLFFGTASSAVQIVLLVILRFL